MDHAPSRGGSPRPATSSRQVRAPPFGIDGSSSSRLDRAPSPRDTPSRNTAGPGTGRPHTRERCSGAEGRRYNGLLLESSGHLGRAYVDGVDHLDRNKPLQVPLPGFVDDAHAAATGVRRGSRTCRICSAPSARRRPAAHSGGRSSHPGRLRPLGPFRLPPTTRAASADGYFGKRGVLRRCRMLALLTLQLDFEGDEFPEQEWTLGLSGRSDDLLDPRVKALSPARFKPLAGRIDVAQRWKRSGGGAVASRVPVFMSRRLPGESPSPQASRDSTRI